jgi:hypothetical protein
MEIAIERIAVVSFLITGLSHMVQPRLWAEFFLMLREKGHVACFINGFIHLPMGLLIIGFHNVWSGIPAVLTVIGWGWVLKGLINFVIPQVAIKGFALVSLERAHRFVIAGALLLGLGVLLGYSLLMR